MTIAEIAADVETIYGLIGKLKDKVATIEQERKAVHAQTASVPDLSAAPAATTKPAGA